MIRFMSDPHFGHANCILFDDRPFKNVEEMNATLIENINSVCKPDDDLYIIGDFCLSPRMYKEIAPQIDCRMHLILGNHDKEIQAKECGHFVEVTPYKKIIVPCNVVPGHTNMKVILSHFPIIDWDCKHNGSVHIYGHVHKNPCANIDLTTVANAYNAFCGYQDFIPWTLDDYIEKYGYNRDIYRIHKLHTRPVI